MTELRILYVEDEPDIRNIAKIALESLGGFIVRDCGSGPEALEALTHFTPDMVILDMMMPGMDGIEILTRLRQFPQTALTPAIFMTAKVQSDEIGQYLKIGAADVIAKPFNPMELPARVQAIWDRHS